MRRRSLLRGVAATGAGLLAGCAGWGGGSDSPADGTTTPPVPIDPSKEKLKAVFKTIRPAENGTLIAELKVWNIRQTAGERRLIVTATVNGTSYRGSTIVEVGPDESRVVNVTVPGVTRDEFAHGGKLNFTFESPAE
ncbi:MAG: hypothetical protein ABEJ08_01920 [Halobacteriaceae archaeon]